MKITKLLILVIILTLPLHPAFAGEKKRSSMMYTTMGKKQENINLKSVEFNNKNINKPENTEKPESPSEQVWERYKALAAGEHEEAAPATEAKATPESKPGPPAKLTGIAGLIQQYQENKKNRGGMRSINVAQPAATKEKSLKDKTPKTQESAP